MVDIMKEIENVIKALQETKNKNNIKKFLEEYKKIYQQLSNERQYRIDIIEQLRSVLLEIKNKNLKIEENKNFQDLLKNYNEKLHKVGDVYIFYHGICGCSEEVSKQKRDEAELKIKEEFNKNIENFGYVKEELVTSPQYVIENYIKDLYKKFVCEEFGHEYLRDKNGKIEVVMEGFRSTEYEVDAFERHTGKILDAGSAGIPTITCKYCGEKIYGNIFEPDFHDKQKILLPINNLDND